MQRDDHGWWRYTIQEWNAIVASIPKNSALRTANEAIQFAWQNELEMSANQFADGFFRKHVKSQIEKRATEKALLSEITKVIAELRALTDRWLEIDDRQSAVRTKDGRDAGRVTASFELKRFAEHFEYETRKIQENPAWYERSRKYDLDLLLSDIFAIYENAGGKLGRATDNFGDRGGPCIRFCKNVTSPLMKAVGKPPLTADQIGHRIAKAKSKRGPAGDFSRRGRLEI